MATKIPIGVSPRAGVSAVTLVMFDERMYVGNGIVNRWMVKVTAQMHVAMVAEAPIRSGALKASIDSEIRHLGSKRISGVVGPTVRHAGYVLRGTGFPVKGHGGDIWTTQGFARRDLNGRQELWMPVKVKDRRWPGETRRQVNVRIKGHYLAFGPDDHGGRVIAHTVRGQEPNNFVLRAYRLVRRRHRALPLAPESIRNP